jgi:hypothetical protein
MTIFNALIWLGAIVAVGGVALLALCILRVSRARRDAASDEALRAALQRIVPLNVGALLLSVLGLMLVVIGILLG